MQIVAISSSLQIVNTSINLFPQKIGMVNDLGKSTCFKIFVAYFFKVYLFIIMIVLGKLIYVVSKKKKNELEQLSEGIWRP